MRMTDWSKIWKHEVLIDGKLMSPQEYQRERRFAALSDDAKIVLAWLAKRKKPRTTISLVELTKCLTPTRLRTAAGVRQLMAELVVSGFVCATLEPVHYSGRLRREAWEIPASKTN
jgi:hypothetical protein